MYQDSGRLIVMTPALRHVGTYVIENIPTPSQIIYLPGYLQPTSYT